MGASGKVRVCASGVNSFAMNSRIFATPRSSITSLRSARTCVRDLFTSTASLRATPSRCASVFAWARACVRVWVVCAIDLVTGIVTTVAGNGQRGVPADGAVATAAPLVDPRAVAADDKGNVYILERGGHALRVVGTDGRIRTVVGTGQRGASGDGGDARLATMNGPKHLCLDREGNVLIADTENHCVRKYLPRTGMIVRVAGIGTKGAAGTGGPPERAELSQPHGVTVHADGTLYIADSSNHRVVKITP